MCLVVARQLANSLLCESWVVVEFRLADVVQIWTAQRICGVVQDGAQFVHGFVDVQEETRDEVGDLLHCQLPEIFVSWTEIMR